MRPTSFKRSIHCTDHFSQAWYDIMSGINLTAYHKAKTLACEKVTWYWYWDGNLDGTEMEGNRNSSTTHVLAMGQSNM